MTKVRDADFIALTSALADVQAHLPGVDWRPLTTCDLLEGTFGRGEGMLWVVGDRRRLLAAVDTVPKWRFEIRDRRHGNPLAAGVRARDAAVAARDALKGYRTLTEHQLRLVQDALRGGAA